MAQTINKCSHFNKKLLVSTEWLRRPGKRYIKQFCCVVQFHANLSKLARNFWLTYRHRRLPWFFATLNGASNWINRLSNSFLHLHLLQHGLQNYEECCFWNVHNYWVREQSFQSRVISVVSMTKVTKQDRSDFCIINVFLSSLALVLRQLSCTYGFVLVSRKICVGRL